MEIPQTDIENCIAALREGGVIVYPTDTIWGIGADASNESAVNKVFEIKNRPKNKVMIALVSTLEMAKEYLPDFPEEATSLLMNQERPTSVIFEGARNLAPLLLGPADSIAIRIPKNEFLTNLIDAFGKPLVSTSANLSGVEFDGTFQGIPSGILKSADYVVKQGREKQIAGLSSRILKVHGDGEITVIRE